MMRESAAGGWWRTFRRTDDATVFHVDLTPHAAHEAQALGCLSGEERSRRDRYRHARRRRQFVLCRAALRAILCGRLGCRNEQLSFRDSGHGKPVALVCGTPAPVHFSVSHSGVHGLIAIAREGRIGVDVEERATRSDLEALMAAVLTPDERAELATAASGSHRSHMFYRLWTVKESLVKALGTGLHLGIAAFEVPSAMRRGVTAALFRFPHLPAVSWRVEDLGNEDFAAALAHERSANADSGPRPRGVGIGQAVG